MKWFESFKYALVSTLALALLICMTAGIGLAFAITAAFFGASTDIQSVLFFIGLFIGMAMVIATFEVVDG